MKKVLQVTFILVFINAFISHGQTILNGDFEKTTATVDEINLTNAGFDTLMSDVYSFGNWNGGGTQGGDPDIITSNNYCNSAYSGSWYVALTGGGTDALALKLSAPLIAGNKYVLKFNDAGCNFGLFSFVAGVSTNDSTQGSIIYTAPKCSNGTWSQRIDTFTAPVAGLYITMQGTGDIGSWGQLDNVSLSVAPMAPTSLFTVSANSICANSPVTVTYTGNGNNKASYKWNFGGATVLSGSGAGPYQVEWATAGVALITLQVTDSFGTSAITKDTMMVNAIPTSTFTVAPIVPAGVIDLVTYTGTATSSNTTYDWKFFSGAIESGSGAGPYNIVWKDPGTYAVALSVTENGCTSTPTMTQVTVTSPLTAATPVCTNHTSTVTYTGAQSKTGVYTWNFSGANVISGSGQGPYVVEWNSAGSYVVSVTLMLNGFQVSYYDTVAVVESAQPLFSSNVTSGCSPLSVAFNGSGNNISTYTWLFGDGTTSTLQDPTHVYGNAGNFDVTLITTNNLGCADTLTIPNYIATETTPTAAFTINASSKTAPDQNVNAFDFTNQSKDASTYLWEFGDGTQSTDLSPTHIYSTKGQYMVTLHAFNSNGCEDTSMRSTFDVQPNDNIFVPTAFTPNGDGKNDILRVFGNNISNFHFSVYDRLGERVYDSNDINQGWDGTYKGHPQSVAVFVYMLTATQDGQTIHKSGNITLIR